MRSEVLSIDKPLTAKTPFLLKIGLMVGSIPALRHTEPVQSPEPSFAKRHSA